MNELTGIALLRSVLPDEFAAQLSVIAFNWRRDKFAIGDIRNSLKAMVEERMLPIAAPDIDDYLADCLNHEIEPRTIRYYAMISYAFPEPTREMYRTLSHAHFALAHSFGGEKSMGVLQLAKDREQNTGKVPSCAWLQAAMSGYIYDKQSGEFPSVTTDSNGFLEDDAPNMPEPDFDASQPIVTGWLDRLHRIVQFSIVHIDAVPLPSEARMKLSDLLAQVDSLLAQYIVMV